MKIQPSFQLKVVKCQIWMHSLTNNLEFTICYLFRIYYLVATKSPQAEHLLKANKIVKKAKGEQYAASFSILGPVSEK